MEPIRRVVITGISGFIGRATAKAFASAGWQVLGFDRHPKPVDGASAILKGDIYDFEDAKRLRDLVKESDGVVNLAGVLGTSELLDGAVDAVRLNIDAAVRLFTFCRECGKPAVQITVGNKDWLSVYPITKVAAERIALAFNKDMGTRIAVVRAMNAYGPWQKAAPVRKLVPNLIRWAMLDEPSRIYGDGEQELDAIHVDDVGAILRDALEYAAKPNVEWASNRYPMPRIHDLSAVFEAGTGVATTVNRLADMVWKEVQGVGVAPKVYETMRPGEPPKSRTVADIKTLEPLGWSNRPWYDWGQPSGPPTKAFIPLDTGLRKTVAWYREHPEILGIPAEAAAK